MKTDTLRLQRPYMHGSACRRLQEMCDELGFDTGDNDAIFGPATERAVKLAQEKLNLKVDGICGPKTWRAVIAAVDADAGETLGNSFVDIRGTHPPARLYKCKRAWSTIKGVTMHQTGCNMMSNPRAWKRLNAHIGMTQEGRVAYVNDATDYIWHGQSLSRHTIGLEFEGNFCGIQGNEKTLWKGGGPAAVLTPEMLRASDALFDFILGEFQDNGQRWTLIHAHRQSSATRRADPGSAIWKQIAMVWAERLGLKRYDRGGSFCYKKGRVIPVDWNPAYKGKY